jgi:hypothetical protein
MQTEMKSYLAECPVVITPTVAAIPDAADCVEDVGCLVDQGDQNILTRRHTRTGDAAVRVRLHEDFIEPTLTMPPETAPVPAECSACCSTDDEHDVVLYVFEQPRCNINTPARHCFDSPPASKLKMLVGIPSRRGVACCL